MNLVTESSLVAIYEMLVRLPPMNKWKLPPSKKIEFRVRKLDNCLGMFEPDPHIITISTLKNGHLDTVIRTMAHEIIHLYLYQRNSRVWDQHGKTFTDLTSRVSSRLGFDPKEL